MPLLALFSKKGKSSSRASASVTGHSTSNLTLSLDDDEYVSVSAPSPVSYHPPLPASSSKLALPFRKKSERSAQSALGQQPHLSYVDPLLEPPPRRSSLFQNFQDENNAYRSTQSLPDHAERSTLRPQSRPQQQNLSYSTPPKKSMFSWGSNKPRSKTTSPTKLSSNVPDDTSFNLKSFRHVRPDSPIFNSSGPRSSSPSPTLPPIPTSTIPSSPVSFQVTSRRPRGNSISELANSPSPPAGPQQKMPAGAFRQAARRSATSLSLTDSPMLSPVRSSLDDRPPPSLLSQPQPIPDTPPPPPRSQPPATSLPTLTHTTSPFPDFATTRLSPTQTKSPSPPKPAPPQKPVAASNQTPRTRTNAFAASSSSSSTSSEDEEEDSDSTSNANGAPRVSRKRTITQGQGQTRAATLPPLSASVREQIQRATPPATSSLTLGEQLFPSSSMNNVPRAQSSMGLYGAGTRPRASLSVGALTPSAKEARASVAAAANARLANAALVTPKATPKPLPRSPGSDTSESAGSGSDSDEDAPLSSLVPPRRPGTSMSSSSSPASSRKPLVDLEAPSSLTGRPVRAPPPMARDEEAREKSRTNGDSGARSRTSQAPSLQSTTTGESGARFRTSQAPSLQTTITSRPALSQDPRSSQGPSSPSSRISQSSSRPLTSPDTPTTPSFSGSSSRQTSTAPSGNSGSRLSTKPNMSPVAPPMRPFARRESPASSTGDSSSGKVPLTPRDGSDTRSAYSAVSTNKVRHGVQRNGHGRKPSVTFDDEKEATTGKEKQKASSNPEEARRKDRRRNEARNAIELGNVVNGPPPVDDDDIVLNQQHHGPQGAWSQSNMQMPMQVPMPPVPPMFNMNMGMPSPGTYGINFPAPSPGPDPAFLVAHQQAMAIAKQTFQYAVAQQALAAANDEWERSSSMTGFGGPAQPWGYGMGMRQSAMFNPGPRSMYAGSVGGGGGWAGTGSVYGNAFGPATAGMRSSTYSQVDLSPGAQRPVRPRTKTAPSAASPPAGTPKGRTQAPPSSFRGTGR